MATLQLAARRRRLPDPRILIGVALVVASAVGTTVLVAGLTRTATVYRAPHALVAGDRLRADGLARMTVRLGDAQGLYLAGPIPDDGLVVTRTVAAGEMVPRSAVGTPAAVSSATVVVALAAPLAAGVGAGDAVDLWAAPRADGAQERYGAPVVLVSDAVVVRAPDGPGLVPGARDDAVEVQVPRGDVASVLEAQSRRDRVTAVAIGSAR